jgi:predicted secreted protein
MNLASAIAIYFIIWWLVLFLVLPFGIRNAHETGEAVEAGMSRGASRAPPGSEGRLSRRSWQRRMLPLSIWP